MTLIGTEPNISQEVYLKAIRRISEATTIDELALNQVGLLSCKAISFQQLPSVGFSGRSDKSRYFSEGFPEDIKSYFDNQDGKPAPTLQYVLSQSCPLWLSELENLKDIFDADHISRLGTALQLVGDSLFMPLFGPYNQRGLVAVSFQQNGNFFDTVFKWQLWGLLQAWQAKYGVISNSIRPSIHLTNRESEVLELITFGNTNPEIGNILGISTSTVSSYVKQIFLKLGVTDRVTAAIKALSFKP